MTTIASVRADLATIAGLPDGEWYGSAYVTDQINPGAVIVRRPPFTPFLTMGSTKAEYMFRLVAYAARAGGPDSEAALDALCDPTGSGSMIAAIQNGSNWTTSIDYAQVVQAGNVDVTQYGQDSAEYLAVYFDVKVVW